MEINKSQLSFLRPQLVDEIIKSCSFMEFDKGTEILKEDQYVNMLPIVIEGLVKVYSRFDEKELLLYYIEPEQSCVMSFNAALNNTPSKIFAITEEKSKLLLIPVKYLPIWLREFPDFNDLFYNQYNLRYTELLDTIKHLLNDKLDKRLFNHLKKKMELTNNNAIKLSHAQIANELGTAREVISRIIKKLENDGKLTQNKEGIKIISEL